MQLKLYSFLIPYLFHVIYLSQEQFGKGNNLIPIY